MSCRYIYIYMGRSVCRPIHSPSLFITTQVSLHLVGSISILISNGRGSSSERIAAVAYSTSDSFFFIQISINGIRRGGAVIRLATIDQCKANPSPSDSSAYGFERTNLRRWWWDELRRGAQMAGGGANKTGGYWKGLCGEGEGAYKEGDGVGSIGVHKSEANVGEG